MAIATDCCLVVGWRLEAPAKFPAPVPILRRQVTVPRQCFCCTQVIGVFLERMAMASERRSRPWSEKATLGGVGETCADVWFIRNDSIVYGGRLNWFRD